MERLAGISGKGCGKGSGKKGTSGGMLNRGGRGIFDDFPDASKKSEGTEGEK